MRKSFALAVCWALLVEVSTACAGMPSPLPTDYRERFFQLNESALHRLQTISFFLFVFFICAWVVKLLWNGLRRDFPGLPQLSYRSAVTSVFLWGLIFVIVLAMISGARELMTPGAWKQQGFTYKLVDQQRSPYSPPDTERDRRTHLEKLRLGLWEFAATHGGHFPNTGEVSALPSDLWEVPGGGGMKYFYVSDLIASRLPEVLAYEPELVTDQRLVLLANGDIVLRNSTELLAALNKQKRQ